MSKAHRRSWLSVLTVLVLGLSIFTGCSDDDDVTCPQCTAPELPPQSAFVMDFSDFIMPPPSQIPLPADIEGEAPASMENWTWAATNVLVWNTLIRVGLAVPTAAFIESFSHEPVRQTDGTWVWSYNFYVAGLLYLAQLHGRVEDDAVHWEMYISKQGAYTQFLWYEGESNLAATEGTWTLNSNPDDPYPLVGILWHRNPGAGTADIKYTNIVPDGAENGGYIFYGLAADGDYDAFYDIYNKGLDNHTDIEWKRLTKDGRVSDPHHFGDADWRCWDTGLEDVECP